MNCKDDKGNLIAHCTGTFLIMTSKEKVLKKIKEHNKINGGKLKKNE
ncbi:MAG: hypothetical protein ACFE9Q_07155 [Candidatus Hodarchaeota archaeon]